MFYSGSIVIDMAGVWRYLVLGVAMSIATYGVSGTGYDTDPGLRYGGQFQGGCSDDGMFYMDDSSFVMCTHSIAYIMPCAPGTMNSGRQLQNMVQGESYGFTAFCDVNLVDMGYAAFHSQRNGFGNSGGGYGTTGGGGGGYQSNTGGGGGGYQANSGGGAAAKVVITYQKKQTVAQSPKYAVGYAQQQPSVKRSYGSVGATQSRAPQATANAGYGRVISYGQQQQVQQPQRTSYSAAPSGGSTGGFRYYTAGRQYK